MSDRSLLFMSIAIILVLMVFGNGVVTAGLFCGLLTGIGFLLLALKSKRVRVFARKHPLLADVVGSVGGYFLFPAGVTAFIGAGVVAIMLTGLIALDLLINGHPEPRKTVTARQALASRAAVSTKGARR